LLEYEVEQLMPQGLGRREAESFRERAALIQEARGRRAQRSRALLC
jgi:hypothetical protein